MTTATANRPGNTTPTRIGSDPELLRSNAPRIHTLAHPTGPVLLHSSRDRYLDHVEKHFAKAESLQALAFALPTTARSPEFASDRALIRALRCDARDPRSANVIKSYAHCAVQTLNEAAALGWLVSPTPGTTIALATSGLIAVIDRGVLRTMFFAGIECPISRADRLCHSAADTAAEQRRAAAWSAEEQYFYRVFRPALQLIRSLPDDAVAGASSQYGALKRVLPSASALRLAGWLSFRARSATARLLHDESFS